MGVTVLKGVSVDSFQKNMWQFKLTNRFVEPIPKVKQQVLKATFAMLMFHPRR